MRNNTKCRTCNIELEKGFVPDYSHGLTHQSKWVEGEVEDLKSWFMKSPGVKPPSFSEGIPIQAYRCPSCGLLEFYAKENN